MKGISIKSQEEIELMREAGRILAITHEELRKALKPGMSTYDIDRLGEEVIRSYGCEPSFLNYQGYPASICVSVNEEVVHGIPSKDRIQIQPEHMALVRQRILQSILWKRQSSASSRGCRLQELEIMCAI